MLGTGLGFALLTADAADAEGIDFANFSVATEKRCQNMQCQPRRHQSSGHCCRRRRRIFAQALTACLNDDNVDGVVITLSPTAANATPRTTQLLANAAKTSFKPVIVCWAAPFAESLMRSSFKRSGLPCLATPQLAVRAFANLARYESLKSSVCNRLPKRSRPATPILPPRAASLDKPKLSNASFSQTMKRPNCCKVSESRL